MQNYTKFLLLLCLFLTQFSWAFTIVETKPWEYPWRGRGELSLDLQGVIQALEVSTLGKQLVKLGEMKSQKYGASLVEMIGEAQSSYTDFTIQRIRTSRGSKLNYKGKIFLDRNTNVRRAVFDLAHELVHFIWQSRHDPFDTSHQFADYMHSVIEGVGGEADAFVMECRIAKELSPKSWHQRYPCRHISGEGKPSREKALAAFYKVGKTHSYIKEQLGSDSANFPYLSPSEPVIIAGVWNHPYPLALLSEFQEVRKKVCKQRGSGCRQ